VIGEPGNAARGSCLGPGINNLDMSFYKNFAPRWLTRSIGEAARIQFRMEFFNALNHTQFRADSLQNNVFFNAGGNQWSAATRLAVPPTASSLGSHQTEVSGTRAPPAGRAKSSTL